MWVRVVVVDEDSVTAGNRNASRLNLAALPSASQLEDPMAGRGAQRAVAIRFHPIEPAKAYWRNQLRDAGRWPGFRATG